MRIDVRGVGRRPARALAAAAALALASCVAAPEIPVVETVVMRPEAAPRGLLPGRVERLDAAMQGYVDRGELAGAVVLVHRDGAPAIFRAYGWRDKEAGDPMQEDAIFRIASQTKALTSVAIMMLQEEGKLLIEDPLSKHLPEWVSTRVAVAREGGGHDVVPAARPITLRHLLTHTAGVSYGQGPAEQVWRDAGVFGWYFADRAEPVADVAARMAALPMAAQPGEAFVYGYATDILGVVVEKVSGMSLAEFFERRITGPLGMDDTRFCVRPEDASRLAVVYSAGPQGVTRAPDPGQWSGMGHVGQGHYLNGPCRAFSGGAGLTSTAADYARFLEMLRRGGELDGVRLLSRKSVELMTEDHLVDIDYPAGTGFGLGFRIVNDVGANGRPASEGEYSWGGAYHSAYWVDPEEGLSVVYMTQLIPGDALDDRAKLRALIHQALE